MTRGAVVALFMLTMLPREAMAQDVAHSLQELLHRGLLTSGDVVYVTEATTGRRTRSLVRDLSPTTLTLTGGLSSWTLAEPEIKRLDVRDPVKNGAWWGFVVGLGIGFALAHPGCSYDGEQCPPGLSTMIGSPVGAIGAGVGAIVDFFKLQTVYRRQDPASVTVAPAARNDGVGARVSVVW